MPINIATAIDSLVELVKSRKKIELEEAAKSLALPINIINEWANFLEEEGVIKITYKFTTPYLEIKEQVQSKEDQEQLKRRLDLSVRRLQLMLSRLAKFKIQHKYEINDLGDVKLLLKNKPGKISGDILYAEKFILEYNINEILDTIKKIKLLTVDLMKFIEKKVSDLEDKKHIFEKNYYSIK